MRNGRVVARPSSRTSIGPGPRNLDETVSAIRHRRPATDSLAFVVVILIVVMVVVVFIVMIVIVDRQALAVPSGG
jgi:t-SNARE complex subunit (syntaxin)